MSSSFEVVRTTSIAADPARVHALVNDFHEWSAWSPWEGLDPAMSRTFSGPESGVGAHYSWKGNKKVGEGSMEIIGSTPERIDIDLRFLKPFAAHNKVDVNLTPTTGGAGPGTDVVYRMTGEHKGLFKLISKFVSMDKMVGKDFEKGLAQLKTAAEDT